MRGCLANQGDLDVEWNNFIGEQAVNVFVSLKIAQFPAIRNIIIVRYEIFVWYLMFPSVLTVLKVHTIPQVNILLN